jgi:putative NAD(P)H nitroreductase
MEETMDIVIALKERRSINFFDPTRTIPPETIDEILRVANLAPSSFNLQPWEVVVVDLPERKRALRKCASNQSKVEESSVMLIVIANPNAIEENMDRVLDAQVRLGYATRESAEKSRPGPGKRHGVPDSVARKIFAVKNTAFFAMSVMAAARGFGLETHPMDGFNEDMVKKEFGIPDDRIIPLLIAVGYLMPGVTLLPRAFRRELDEFVHRNRY